MAINDRVSLWCRLFSGRGHKGGHKRDTIIQPVLQDYDGFDVHHRPENDSEDCAPFCAPSPSETVDYSELIEIMDEI